MFQLTVKRGVSFLMSSNDTSIPITPRINWFWCWEKVWEKKNKENIIIRSADSTHSVFKQIFFSLHLAIPVIFGLGFIEDRECSSDDQTQFLMRAQANTFFKSGILSL